MQGATFVGAVVAQPPDQAVEKGGHHEDGSADVEHNLMLQVVENYWLKSFP